MPSRLKSFCWCYLLINAGGLAPSLMSPCPCCLCLRVCATAFLFLLCWLHGRGWWGRIQHLLGLNHEQMGQFGVLLQALCPRVLLISTFFFPPPLRPSREVVLVTSLVVNNSFQWDKLEFCCGLLHPSGTFTI